VGVNCFTGENELEVSTPRVVPHPYDPDRREEAERKQLANLQAVKRHRDNQEVGRLLKRLGQAARKEEENLFPYFLEGVKAYATVQEMCDVLREFFGEYRPAGI
jgi:methylmalonyl-CoA mutase N-terminal domain/subunit